MQQESRANTSNPSVATGSDAGKQPQASLQKLLKFLNTNNAALAQAHNSKHAYSCATAEDFCSNALALMHSWGWAAQLITSLWSTKQKPKQKLTKATKAFAAKALFVVENVC
ncbi:MAG: hypothetical protein P3M72_00175 [Candidatus Hodgkinia cicadicola]|nr:MAG: hypothetical protein P3M72_00175 [Candidatus Hodgkinia cicadicola]